MDTEFLTEANIVVDKEDQLNGLYDDEYPLNHLIEVKAIVR